MSEYFELWHGGPLFAQAEHFRLGTDSVLLADFVGVSGAARGIDLGCASGAVTLLLLEKYERLHMTGLEIVPEAAELARRNMAKNALDGRARIICGDIRRHRELFRAGEFDFVVSNPPYFPLGSGALSPDRQRAAARGETDCTLEDVCAASAFLCRSGGSVFLVHKPERLSELFCRMSACGLEPKRLRLVCHSAEKAPGLVLVEGRRGGRPGLRIELPLILRNADGTETDEVLKIYHREDLSQRL